jgi:DNA polymerase-3 subunit alpha
MGQMMLFGGGSEVIGSVLLPETGIFDTREQLEWEKELLGLYVTENPLSAYMSLISNKISHLSSDFEELESNTKVKVGGVVKKVRQLLTKTNKNMGFVTIEDSVGDVELVVFPSVWERSSQLIETGAILVVNGKLDKRENGDSILVDQITRENLDNPAEPNENNRNQGPFYDKVVERYLPNIASLAKYAQQNVKAQARYEELADKPLDVPNITADAEIVEEVGWADDTLPQFSDLVSFDSSIENEFDEAFVIIDAPSLKKDIAVPLVPSSDNGSGTSLNGGLSFIDPVKPAEPLTRPTLTVTLVSTGEAEKDWRRFIRVHGLLCSHPGDARFVFIVSENNGQYQVDFPNDSTDLSQQILDELEKLVGLDNVQVVS